MSRAPQRLLLTAAASAALALVMTLVVLSGSPASSLAGGTIDLDIPADTMPRDDTPITAPVTTAPTRVAPPTTSTTVRPTTTTTAPASTTTLRVPTGGIYGQVVDGQDQPVSGVCLTTSSLDPTQVAVTAADGTFTFDRVGVGPLRIVSTTTAPGCPLVSVMSMTAASVLDGLWTPVLLRAIAP